MRIAGIEVRIETPQEAKERHSKDLQKAITARDTYSKKGTTFEGAGKNIDAVRRLEAEGVIAKPLVCILGKTYYLPLGRRVKV